MDELENDVTYDVTDDVETSYEEDTTNYDTETELTVDDYKKEKARREKAEKALVDLKKQLKTKPEKEAQNLLSEKDLDLRDEVRDYVKDNPELKDYKDDIIKHRKNGYSLKQAIAIVENDDNTIENRKKTNALNMTTWEESEKTTYTKADLADPNLSQEKYDKIMAKVRTGEIKLK